jgi:hypothetical protein
MTALDQLDRSQPSVYQVKTKKAATRQQGKELEPSRFPALCGGGGGPCYKCRSFGFSSSAWGQSADSGLPAPDEAVEATLKRLFSNRSMTPGEGKIKLGRSLRSLRMFE